MAVVPHSLHVDVDRRVGIGLVLHARPQHIGTGSMEIGCGTPRPAYRVEERRVEIASVRIWRIASVGIVATEGAVVVVDHRKLSVGIDIPFRVDLPVEHGEESSVVHVVAPVVDAVHIAAGKQPEALVPFEGLEVGHVERRSEAALVGGVVAERGKGRGTDVGVQSLVQSEVASGCGSFVVELLRFPAIYDGVGGSLHGVARQQPVLARAVGRMERPQADGLCMGCGAQ